MNPMNPYAMKINGLIQIRILRIHDFCVSLGKDSKKVHVVSGFNTKIIASCIDGRIRFLDFSFLSQGLIRD